MDLSGFSWADDSGENLKLEVEFVVLSIGGIGVYGFII